MSFEEKMGLTMMMELIEGELEERKMVTDRRQKECEDEVKQEIEAERRQNQDRRSLNS